MTKSPLDFFCIFLIIVKSCKSGVHRHDSLTCSLNLGSRNQNITDELV